MVCSRMAQKQRGSVQLYRYSACSYTCSCVSLLVPSYIITQHTEQAISPQGHQWNPYLKIKQYLKEFRKNSIAQP